MDWTRGYSSYIEVNLVDPVTWQDKEALDVLECSIDLSSDGEGGSASLKLKRGLPKPQWVRIWLVADQGGIGSRVPLFTGITSVRRDDPTWVDIPTQVDCYSSLLVPDKWLLPRGYYVGEGSDPIRVAASLLRGHILSSVIMDGECNEQLSSNIIAEDNETALTMSRYLVETYNWRLRVDGLGDVTITNDDSPALSLDSSYDIVVTDGIDDTKDEWDKPTTLEVIFSNGSVEVVRDDEAISELGFEVCQRETDVSLSGGESAESYAKRRLRELRATSRTVKWTREFVPNVFPGDVVDVVLPSKGINGLFRITSQSLSFGGGVTVNEEVIEC